MQGFRQTVDLRLPPAGGKNRRVAAGNQAVFGHAGEPYVCKIETVGFEITDRQRVFAVDDPAVADHEVPDGHVPVALADNLLTASARDVSDLEPFLMRVEQGSVRFFLTSVSGGQIRKRAAAETGWFIFKLIHAQLLSSGIRG